MDLLREQWLSELEADEPDIINQWEMKSVDDIFMNHHSSESYSAYPSSSTESIQEISSQSAIAKSTKEIKNNYFSFHTSPHESLSQKVSPSDSSNIISFGDLNSPRGSMHDPYGPVEYVEPKRVCKRTLVQAQDHVLAERKRRERLSERFVALSTMIPGLKKLDKASVLGGAIKYLAQLEERTKTLEDRLKMLENETKRKKEESDNISSVSKRSRLCSSDETSSSDQNSDATLDQPLPEIEVSTSDTNVLVRVCCGKRNGIIKEILCEIEKLHLGIVSSSVIPFGSTTLNIIVIAQMDGDIMGSKDIANTIRMAIQKRM